MSYYFDFPSMGIPTIKTVEKSTQFIANLSNKIKYNNDYTIELIEMMEELRKKIANTYHVLPRNIAFISNTSEGLGTIAEALIRKNARLKIAVPDIEFISSALVWHGKETQLTYIDTEQGAVSTEKIKHTLEKEKIDVLCMSSVQEVSGYRFSFQELTSIYEKNANEFWIIDGIQEAGVIRRNLIEDQIDAYIVGGHKWLNNVGGLGFMFISDRLLHVMKPSYYGYFNLEEPKDGWINYLESRDRSLKDLETISRRTDASVFEPGGMINALGGIILKTNIDAWKSFGLEEAYKHIMNLQKTFRDTVNFKKEFTIIGGANPRHWSSIITITNHDNNELERKLFTKLREIGFKLSLRSIANVGGIRIGFHYTTTHEEVIFLANQLNRCMDQLEN